jgi:hypothetical protein
VTVLQLASAIRDLADDDAWASQSCLEAEARIPAAKVARDFGTLQEILAGAVAAYERAVREGMPQSVRLRTAETIRRVERAVGQTLREGQDAGDIRRAGQSTGPLPNAAQVLGLRDRSAVHCFYEMTGGTDDGFEAALRGARTEGSLARSTVARHLAEVGRPPEADWIPEASDRSNPAAFRRRALIKEMAATGNSSRQIADLLGTTDVRVREVAKEMRVTIRADKVIAGTRRGLDSNRIATETATTLDGAAASVELINLADIDRAQAKAWATSLTASLRVLNRFAKQMKEMA